MSTRLIDCLATTPLLAEVFEDRSVLEAMLRFEVALARAEAGLGVIPALAAETIAAAAAVPDAFDPGHIAAAATATGTVAIGVVARLTALVRERDAEGASYVHWGATSQDVTDTAMVLLLDRVRTILQADHQRLLVALRSLSDRHAATVMSGRTLLQPSTPVTFGLKAAGWHAACARGWRRVSMAFDEALVLQFGGASGTLAALGDRGPDVASALGRELGLRVPSAPWHAHRDRLGGLMAALGVYTASLGKMATDVSLLMQAEVGEAAESGGVSSSMPQKRNPAGCAVALAAATRVPGLVAAFLSGMAQQHERGLGGGHAEMPTIAAIAQAAGAALSAITRVAGELQIDPARMRANIDATRGTMLAERAVVLLAPVLGREAARALVATAAAEAMAQGRGLGDVLASISQVADVRSRVDLTSLDHPDSYLGAAERFRLRLLADS